MKDHANGASGLEQRDKLIAAAMPHVPFDGWSVTALRAGARDLGLPDGDVEELFPGGVRQAVRHFSHWADRRMLAALGEVDLTELRIREKVALAVELRLKVLEPHREAVRRGLSWLAMPQNAMLGTRLLCRTVDDIWHAIGDRSVDFSFYTKRGLLAGVVGSTTLFWLDDDSEDGAETSAFLERRIGDVMKIQGARRRAEDLKGPHGLRGGTPNPFRILRDAVVKRYGANGRFGDSRFT